MKFTPIKSLQAFYTEARHVMSVAYRPDAATFKRTLKIVLLGVLLLGVLGFIMAEILHFIV